MEFRGSEEGKEPGNSRTVEESKIENGRMYYNCRKDLEESDYKNIHSQPKDGKTKN